MSAERVCTARHDTTLGMESLVASGPRSPGLSYTACLRSDQCEWVGVEWWVGEMGDGYMVGEMGDDGHMMQDDDDDG